MLKEIFECLEENGDKTYHRPDKLSGSDQQEMLHRATKMKLGKKTYDNFIKGFFGDYFKGDYKLSSANWLSQSGIRTKKYFWVHYYKLIPNYKEIINITFTVINNSFELKFAYNDDFYKKNNLNNIFSELCLDVLYEINFDYLKLKDFNFRTSNDDVNHLFNSLDIIEQKNYLINNREKLIKYNNFYFTIDYIIKRDDSKSDSDYQNLIGNHLSEIVKFYEIFYDLFIDKISRTLNYSEKEQIDEKNVQLNNDDNHDINYWIYSPGTQACKWEEFNEQGIMAIEWSELGELKKYLSKDAIQEKMATLYDDDSSHSKSAHMIWQFANEIKVGDIIFVKKGRSKIIGKGIVESDYYYDINRTDDFKNVRKVKWTHKVNYDHPGTASMKTLTNITDYPEYVESLNLLFNQHINNIVEYTKKDFLNDIYIDEELYDSICNVLSLKKNIILQGPPGVGKTFMAKRLAYSLIGEENDDRIGIIQFHQSYSYEDFVMGYKPKEDGFYLKTGCFYDFCKKAEEDSERNYYFIIDEINRGNLSKIFGELFMLIENDKRGHKIRLMYQEDDNDFSIPKNLYIIGMMNTADRSLAMLDYALRRRFSFIDITPAFDNEKFVNYEQDLDNIYFNKIINKIKQLNEEIRNDESLGEGFMIGHSYFCNFKKSNLSKDTIKQIIEYEIVPLIKEYWFDETNKANKWIEELRGIIK